MRRLSAVMTLCLALLFGGQCEAISYVMLGYENMPGEKNNDIKKYVKDDTHILTPTTRWTINSRLARLEERTGVEVAVVVVDTIDIASDFVYAHTLFNEWGIGKENTDNGLLILLVTKLRSIRFVTGFGMEFAMPDAKCKRIQQQFMMEPLSRGDYDTAMLEGVEAVCKTIEFVTPPKEEESGGLSYYDKLLIPPLILFVVSVIIIITVIVYADRVHNITFYNIFSKRCCARCGNNDFEKMSSVPYIDKKGRHRCRETYICNICGNKKYVDHKDRTVNSSGDSGGDKTAIMMTIGAILSSLLRRGGFGGGTGFNGGTGGGFGGGQSGGGGAGSSW